MNRQVVGYVRVLGCCLLVLAAVAHTAAADPPSLLHKQAMDYRDQGVQLQHRGDLDGAAAMFQKSIYLDPSYPTPHNDLGVIYEAQGRVQDAEREYQTALELNPRYAKAHTNLALLYEQRGLRDKAAYHWMQRHALGPPDDAWTVTAQQRLTDWGYWPLQQPEPPVSSVPQEILQEVPQEPPVAQSAPADPPPPSASPEQLAAEEKFDRFDAILDEFETVTDPDGTIWGSRKPKTTGR